MYYVLWEGDIINGPILSSLFLHEITLEIVHLREDDCKGGLFNLKGVNYSFQYIVYYNTLYVVLISLIFNKTKGFNLERRLLC